MIYGSISSGIDKDNENIDTLEKVMIKTLMENRWKEIVMIEEANKKKKKSISRSELSRLSNQNRIYGTERCTIEKVKKEFDNKDKQSSRKNSADSYSSITALPPVKQSSVIQELENKIKERIEGAIKLSKKLEELKEQSDKVKSKEEEETNRIENALEKYNRRRMELI